MRLPKWLGSTPIIILLILVFLGISALQFNQWRKRHQIQIEIDHITQQQQELEQKNQDLSASLNLLDTQGYKEKIAREQLNLKKDGEIVVNFSQAQANEAEAGQPQQTNPQKWWYYFFKTN